MQNFEDSKAKLSENNFIQSKNLLLTDVDIKTAMTKHVHAKPISSLIADPAIGPRNALKIQKI